MKIIYYCTAKFEISNKEYHFYTDSPEFKEGDIVFVSTQRGLAVAEFVEYIGYSDKATQPVIGKKEDLE